jgi:hypothetical protein
VDALLSTDIARPSRGGSGRWPGESRPAFPPTPAARAVENRAQLVARRRAAQHAWRAACERVERAAQYLRETLSAPHSPAATTARRRMEHAQRGERQARTSYYRVAEETGTLLSGLERTDAERV